MIDKIVGSIEDAMAGIGDGATVLIAGFGVGQPNALIEGLLATGARDLTIVTNSGGRDDGGVLFDLLDAGRVRRLICTFIRATSLAGRLYRDGQLEVELVPQGTLAERMRAAGAGIPAFFTPTGAGTRVAEGKETRHIAGRDCILEHALHGDVALIEAWQADRWGNLTFRDSARNFNPVMAMAGRLTIVQSQHVMPLGEIEPMQVMTPGIFVDRVLHVPYGDPPESVL